MSIRRGPFHPNTMFYALHRGISHFFPPHPDPLPWGEGEPYSTLVAVKRALHRPSRRQFYPLLGERDRVRGTAAQVIFLIILLFLCVLCATGASLRVEISPRVSGEPIQ